MVGFLCILCVGGCSESAGSGTNTNWVMDESELEFQSQSNNPPTAKTLWAMADILATQGRDSECEYVLKRIIQDNPKFLPAYNNLAELQMRQGHTSTAIETLQHALKSNSNDTVILNNLGMCWIVQRDYEKALKMFTKAAGIMPENVKYRANMAVALGLMGRDEESLSLFNQILPEDQAKYNLSVLQEARL
jgi:serine/threonine-protein kinase